jgi:hypothetical protein
MIPNEAFLSHSSSDQIFARHLTDELRRHGVPIWYSKTNILGARQWHDEIGDALKRCDWFIVILSPKAVESMWVNREVTYALQQDRFANRIVPLLHQDCDFERLSWVLSSIQMVDFQGDFEAGCRDLLRVWGIGYKKV